MKKKILLIDDDPVSRYIYNKIIEQLGIDCEIRMASNGKDALNIMFGDSTDSFIPDYIFVDLNMPTMDGFQFIQRFHAEEAPDKEHSMIIVLTSSDNNEDRYRAIGLGIQDYVVKPIEEPYLLRLLA